MLRLFWSILDQKMSVFDPIVEALDSLFKNTTSMFMKIYVIFFYFTLNFKVFFMFIVIYL